ncbi:MAG: universal stress protein [Pyrinomonadaceae bacterium]|nr:universal stress protein [Pyrinomonadaceae bacterium]
MRILLATDGSEYAKEAAAQCGELIVNLKDVIIKIITVSDYIVDFDSDAFVSEGEFVRLLEREIRKRSTNILGEAEKIVRYNNENVQIEKEFFIGTAKKLIVKEANKWKPDLIVVGSHGYGFWKRAMIGSVSDAVVHHAPCSVLVVRKK